MKRLAAFFTSDHVRYGSLVALAAIMPLHALLTISLGRFVGHQSLWQAWKEGLVLANVVLAAWLLARNTTLRRAWLRRPLVRLVGAFAAVALTASAVHGQLGSASFWYGLKIDLEFFIVLLLAGLVSYRPARLQALVKTVLGVSSAIGVFALLQVYALPVNALARLGYDLPSTVPSYHLVDPAVRAVRIIATFAGPNQLGSFMLIPLLLALWLVLQRRWWALAPLALSGFSLWHSYSRSAWLGAVAATIILMVLSLQGLARRIAIAAGVALVLVGGLYYRSATTQTVTLRYFLLHGQYISTGELQGSDQYRLSNLRSGLQEVKAHPWGGGLGTAGPASEHSGQAAISENFYVQIALETGVLGLALFVAALAYVGYALVRLGPNGWGYPLAAILVGISLCNLFLHTWSDSATALVYCVLAGYALGERT